MLTALGLGTLAYAWVLLIDPYDLVPFSIPYERKPVTGNRRFATPPLAAIPLPGSVGDIRANECTRRLGRMAAEVPNALALDFMFRSDITLPDRNFWDSVHYTEDVATVVGESVERAITRNEWEPGLFVLPGENGRLPEATEGTSPSTIGKRL